MPKLRNLRRSLFLIFLFCIHAVAHAQFTDDFSDGDFTANPPWVGDREKFIIDNGMLRLYDDDAGTAYLATHSNVVHHTQWEFWVRLAFTPSDNNHVRIYLVSDRSNLNESVNGYFLQIGKTGGDNKRLYFYRQDGDASVELMAGSMNLAAATNNILRIRVTRDGFGNWLFMADPNGGQMFIIQGEAFDNTYTAASWFGVLCTYTISNNRRFYFDYFYVGEIIPDDPPHVENVEVSSPNTLDVYFSSILDRATATSINNYYADGGLGHPLVVSFDEQTPNRVRLLFFAPFEVKRLYSINISGVESHGGQPMEDWQGEFFYYVPDLFDVVFNELMVNNSPTVLLPPFDWLELYNTTHLPLNLKGWELQHGTTRRELPHALIPAKGYLVLCTETAYDFMYGYGNVVAVPGLSATAFTIGGTELSLWDDQGSLVSFVHYSDSWYRDPAKSGGGWSLEKIDPYNFCQGAENWQASKDPRGGTPAMQNSVFGDNPDISNPRLLRAALTDSLTVRLTFSEPMDREMLSMPDHYVIDNNAGHPTEVFPVLPDCSKVDILLPEPLKHGVLYHIEVSDRLTDCAGNPVSNRIARLAVPEIPGAGDLVINEILFNPPDYGARYIELFNRSDKVFDLADLLVASHDTIVDVLTTIRVVSENHHLMFPGDYLVLSNDTAAVRRTFLAPDPDAFIELTSMPRMTNAGGILVLLTKSLETIDRMVFTEDMHLPLLASVKGVALERLNPGLPSHDASNWHSAASSVGFGTPGYKNSQFNAFVPQTTVSFSIDQPVFAPDGSGQHDLLLINYYLDEPGHVANVKIFDSRGRMIRKLVQGKLLATSGMISWDGTDESGLKTPIGPYVVFIEVFNQYGVVQNHKLTVVVAGRFR